MLSQYCTQVFNSVGPYKTDWVYPQFRWTVARLLPRRRRPPLSPCWTTRARWPRETAPCASAALRREGKCEGNSTARPSRSSASTASTGRWPAAGGTVRPVSWQTINMYLSKRASESGFFKTKWTFQTTFGHVRTKRSDQMKWKHSALFLFIFHSFQMKQHCMIMIHT